MKTVLLTRSVAENCEIIESLENYNNKTLNKKLHYISSPLIKFKRLKIESNILDKYSDIIITSKFSSKILAEWFAPHYTLLNDSCLSRKESQYVEKLQSLRKNIWIVGKTSADILLKNNFIVKYIADSVEDLIKNIPEEHYHKTVYLSSNEITKQLPPQIARQVIYEVKYATKLQKIEKIKKGVDYILIYSQNSAKTLIKLLLDNNLIKLVSNSLVIAISKKVANIMKKFFQNVIYCDSGKTQQMLELLIYYAKTKK